VEYAAEYFTGERCDGLSIIGLLCIIPFPIAEEVGVQSWSWRVVGSFFCTFYMFYTAIKVGEWWVRG